MFPIPENCPVRDRPVDVCTHDQRAPPEGAALMESCVQAKALITRSAVRWAMS